MSRLSHKSTHLAAAVVLMLGPGCRTYNQRTSGALRDFESGRFDRAMVAYAEDDITHSDFLASAEAGTVALTAGRWGAAINHLTRATEAVREIEEKALVSPETAGETLLSWVLNDTFTTYYGEGYERVMLHACLGLAYLARGMTEDTLVEVRRANALLEAEEELYETEYEAGGLGHFLSAIGYELIGKPDDAYIDYKRMEAKGIGGDLVGRELVRLATKLFRSDELPFWEQRWGPDESRPEGFANVILIAGVGLGPFKDEIRIDVPTGDGVLSWAVPSMQSRRQPVPHLTLEVREAHAGVDTVVIEDVRRVASKNLADRIAWLAAKSAVQSVLKRELRQRVEEEHGGGWAALADIFSIVTQRADLRAWGTLPDTWQAARLFVPPGAVTLDLQAERGQRLELGTFELGPGETMFLLARTLGREVYAHPIGGRPVEARPAEVLEAAPVDG